MVVLERSNAVRHLRIADPDGLMGAIRGSELEPWALSGHPVESELLRIPLPNSCLDQAQLGPAMWFRGAMPKDCYTMVFVADCPDEGLSFNFKSRYRSQCLGFYTPGEALDVMTPAGYRNATLAIPEKSFLQAVESGHHDIPAVMLKRGDCFFPTAKVCRDLTAFLGLMSDTAHQMPDALTSASARETLENELHEHYFGLLKRNLRTGRVATNPGVARRYLRIKLIRDFIQDHLHRRISLAELCAVSGLSRRGVEYLFQDLFGVRVSVFLLRLRLHGVRRDLLAAEPRHGLVKQCALNWGFWHLGRFAAEYRTLFGESPSTTLFRISA